MRNVAAPGADFAETPQQLIRVDGTGVDSGRERRQLLARDRGNLVGDRRCGLLDSFDLR